MPYSIEASLWGQLGDGNWGHSGGKSLVKGSVLDTVCLKFNLEQSVMIQFIKIKYKILLSILLSYKKCEF